MLTSVTIAGNVETSISEVNSLKTIKDELDLGSILIPFSTQAERYQPFDLVEIVENGATEYWLVGSDISTPVDKENLTYHEHKLNIIEYTKILERYPMPDKAYVQLSTGTPLTAEDVVDDLIETVPFRAVSDLTSGAIIDSVDSTLRTILASIIIPDVFSTEPTLKEVLVELFKIRGINAYPRLERQANGDVVLTADFYNNLVTLVDKDANSYFKQASQLSNKYAQSLVSSTKNQSYGFEKQLTAVIKPSPTGWLNGRSDTNLIQVSSAFIDYEDKLVEMIKVEADITYFSTQSACRSHRRQPRR